jgi:hypothetical protein
VPRVANAAPLSGRARRDENRSRLHSISHDSSRPDKTLPLRETVEKAKPKSNQDVFPDALRDASRAARRRS